MGITTDPDYCAAAMCDEGDCIEVSNSYVCECYAGFTGVLCEININECVSNPCSNCGTCMDDINRFLCYCPDGYAGLTCNKEIIKDPQNIEMVPDFGPQAGGTIITITGQYLVFPAWSVSLGNDQELMSDIAESSTTHILAITPPVNDTDINIHQPVMVVFAGGLEIKLNQTFLYKGNPKIESIKPLETIIEGGTTLTVTGTSMDAVLTPVVVITMVYRQKVIIKGETEYKETKQIFKQDCKIKEGSNTTVLCPTPELDIPEEFLKTDTNASSSTSRRKRSLMDILNTVLLSRVKRQNDDGRTIDFKTDDAELIFYLGFEFDGVNKYQNLSEVPELEEYSTLNVYGVPDTTRFSEVIKFKKDVPLRINGTNMKSGVVIDDYTVMIGLDGVCEILDLTDNQLTCMPTSDAPEKNKTSTYHQITMFIGKNVEREIGEIHYEYNTIIWILAGTFGGLFLVLCIILPVVFYKLKQKRMIQKQQEESNANSPDTAIQLGPLPQYDSDEVRQGSSSPINRPDSLSIAFADACEQGDNYLTTFTDTDAAALKRKSYYYGASKERKPTLFAQLSKAKRASYTRPESGRQENDTLRKRDKTNQRVSNRLSQKLRQFVQKLPHKRTIEEEYLGVQESKGTASRMSVVEESGHINEAITTNDPPAREQRLHRASNRLTLYPDPDYPDQDPPLYGSSDTMPEDHYDPPLYGNTNMMTQYPGEQAVYGNVQSSGVVQEN